MKLRSGTRIEIRGFNLNNQVVWYPAKIGRMLKGQTRPDGWHPVTYDDGAKLLGHESGFRVVDNR